MELKNKHQYTYFIHTFLINQNRYNKYLAKILKDKRFELKIFQKENDLGFYTYFLPNIRNFLFKTFDFNKEKIEKLDKLPLETKCAILADMPCITFEYNIKNEIQGKTIDRNSIFFKVQKIGIVCFNTGICFLYFKTNIEGSDRFTDVLNFNYKFRDIKQENNSLNNYDNIKLQADYFDDIKEIKEFITEITGSNFDSLKINIDIERFYTYSYECIDQIMWNKDRDFDFIKNDFLKYITISQSDKVLNINGKDSTKILSKNNFSKIGISKLGVNLFSSDFDENNSTVLPHEYENQYLYTYILSLYLKIYLKKLDYDFKIGKDLKKTRKDFIDFTKNIWIQEITSEDFGSLLYHNIKEVLEVEEAFEKVKNKYDLLYRELKIERTEKISVFIAIVLVITLLFNIINFITLNLIVKG